MNQHGFVAFLMPGVSAFRRVVILPTFWGSLRVVVNDLGTNVSGSGKDSTIAEEVAELVRARGGETIANDSDVSTPQGGSDLIAMTIEHFRRIDLLVNNAGICGSQPFADATLDDFDQYWRVHLGGPVNTARAA
jgi:NAD(P)-dependent dehydrogenase (short-subunit alcohol dehydrogenase family)